MRTVFAVILDEADEAVVERLKKLYGKDALRLNETTVLVRDDALADDIALAAGFKGRDKPAAGVAFKLNRAYSGFTHRSVWEWLERAEAEGMS